VTRALGLVFTVLALGCTAAEMPRPPASPASPKRPAAVAAAAPAAAPAPDPELEKLHAGIEAALAPRASAPTRSPEAELAPIPPLSREPQVDPAVDSSPSARLPPDSVRRVVRLAAGRFRNCYQDALRRAPKIQGRVVVRFVIGPDGAVSSAQEESATLADRIGRQCVLAAFFDLRFPIPPGQNITVSYPLLFSTASADEPVALHDARRVAEAPPPGFEAAFRAGRPVPGPAPSQHQPTKEPAASASGCTAGDPMCPGL
jgi:TonB family protein